MFGNSNSKTSQSGFTLIEMAVVVTIAATLIGMAISFAIPLIESSRRIETQQKIKIIKTALAEYAVQNNRVPCPSSPLNDANYGFENTSGGPANICGTTTGIIPFHTLGIPGTLAFDGWGNPFTYAISPDFAQLTGFAQTSIHMKCRTREWYYSNGRPIDIESAPPVIDVSPINPEKAGFCCVGNIVGNNLQIIDQAGNNILPLNRSTMVAGDLAPATTPYQASILDPTVYPPRTTTPLGIAYVLVSHGGDKLGAFNIATGARFNVPTTACEQTNADSNASYQICDEPAEDILGFETNDAMFASQGETCAGP